MKWSCLRVPLNIGSALEHIEKMTNSYSIKCQCSRDVLQEVQGEMVLVTVRGDGRAFLKLGTSVVRSLRAPVIYGAVTR